MGTLSSFGQLATSLVEVVFPPICVNCGRVGSILCAPCIDQLLPVEGGLCARCGRSLKEESPTLCSECRTNPPFPGQVRAPYYYDEPLSDIIHKLKYDGYFALGRPLGELMAIAWPAWSQPLDLVVPVPLHARRRRRRGFNQADHLAKGLVSIMGLEMEPSALKRVRRTRPQVDLGPTDRQTNVSGAFRGSEEHLGGRHILLLDDVYTSGATMNAAAEAVMDAGAASVSSYCLARVHQTWDNT